MCKQVGGATVLRGREGEGQREALRQPCGCGGGGKDGRGTYRIDGGGAVGRWDPQLEAQRALNNKTKGGQGCVIRSYRTT